LRDRAREEREMHEEIGKFTYGRAREIRLSGGMGEEGIARRKTDRHTDRRRDRECESERKEGKEEEERE
jgi:hypothetical protein